MNEPLDDERPDPRLAALFAADHSAIDAATLSRRTLAHLAPALAANAQRAFRRRVARTLGLALLPLPLVLAMDGLMLGWLYELAAAWLPSGIAAYVVVSYGLAVLVGLGLTYASIPLLLAWRVPGSADEVIA
ncbi:MAG: hypothetical protein ABI629_12905 [bacterium]